MLTYLFAQTNDMNIKSRNFLIDDDKNLLLIDSIYSLINISIVSFNIQYPDPL